MIERLVNFMLWDGVAVLVFGGIIVLGLRFYHAKIALLIASLIPISSLVIWIGHTANPSAITITPFLTPLTYFIMAFGAFIAMMPIQAD